ncbi:MAG: undecaprenyl-diphosphate phosphatase [Gammaproteobacteria bacterium]|nr:undecaprenyl-diphosphate phosphatase [Gammaproteobacteria bacterium]
MESLQVMVLALVQGLTEFLPISSSAHLILVPQLVEWPDQGLAFDVAVHVGTLSAVVWYFRKELMAMTHDWTISVVERKAVGESRLAWAVIFATIPAGLAGILFKDVIEDQLRSPVVIAATTILFGLLLWYADVIGKRERTEHKLDWKDILFIGLAQAMALIPGTSRSGATITAGLLLGLSRAAAARFSFLLSIPIITAAGLLHLKELIESALPVDWSSIIWGTVVSAFSAYLCIHLFLKMLDRIGMLPFVIYRLLLGMVLLYVFL